MTTASELQWPPGFAEAIAKYLYHAAPRPNREAAIAGMLGLLAGINGRAYTVSEPKMGLNLMVALVMASAIGKESMHRITYLHARACEQYDWLTSSREHRDIARSFVLNTDAASAPGMIRRLVMSPGYVNIIGELGKLIDGMCNAGLLSPLHNLKTLILNLSDKSGPDSVINGLDYSDTTKNVPPIIGPAYSIVGESTPDTFYGALTTSTAEDGFLSRWTVIERQSLVRPPRNKNPIVEPSAELLTGIVWMLNHAVQARLARKRSHIPCDVEAESLLNEFDAECDDEINKTRDSALRAAWNRSFVKVYRIAGNLAAADFCGWQSWWAHGHIQLNVPPLEIHKEHVEWAINLERRNIAALVTRIKTGGIGDGDDARRDKVEALLFEYMTEELPNSWQYIRELKEKQLVPYTWLQKRTQKVAAFEKHRMGATAALNYTIRSLVDTGILAECEKAKIAEEFHFNGKCYRIQTLPGYVEPPPIQDWLGRVSSAIQSQK